MVLQSVSGHGVAAQEHLAAYFASHFVVVAVVVRVKVNLSEQKSQSYFYMTISEVRFTKTSATLVLKASSDEPFAQWGSEQRTSSVFRSLTCDQSLKGNQGLIS